MMDEVVYEGDDAGLGHRLTKAIKRAIFGGPEDTNLPDENPHAGTPRDAGRVRQHEERKSTQALDKFKSFGEKLQKNPALQAEMEKARKRRGDNELDATRKALGHD